MDVYKRIVPLRHGGTLNQRSETFLSLPTGQPRHHLIHGPVPVQGSGVADHCSKQSSSRKSFREVGGREVGDPTQHITPTTTSAPLLETESRVELKMFEVTTRESPKTAQRQTVWNARKRTMNFMPLLYHQ
ncbi:hypothetical protein TNCV_4858781 [Trichonephila clavipes]|nr:hypothetical protein TNCV_4858781 [Trichonephila clavipes]